MKNVEFRWQTAVIVWTITSPGSAHAAWGDAWGTMFWETSITPQVPALGIGGLILLLSGLLSAAYLASRKPTVRMGLPMTLVLVAIPLVVAAGTLSVPNTFVNGTPADADEVNANFGAVEAEVNDNDARITSTQAAAAAAQATADAAVTDAAAAQSTADGAASTAATAHAAANSAVAIAGVAQSTATAAGSDAAAAQSTADAAVTAAANAQSTADASSAVLAAEGPHQRPGLRNSAVGVEALLSNTTGSDNVALGENALRNNVDVSQNVGVGRGALRNSSGTGNTAVGYVPMWSNAVTGSYNAAFGWAALYTVTTGGGNVAVGKNAGRGLTAGSGNTLVGTDAGYDADIASSFDDNVMVGHRAGYTATGDPGSSNVYIGAGAGENRRLSNELFIENSSDVVTPLIYGDFAAEEVGIGTSNPAATLHVSGDGRFDSHIQATPVVGMWYPWGNDGSATTNGDGFWDWDVEEFNTNSSAFVWSEGGDEIFVNGAAYPGFYEICWSLMYAFVDDGSLLRTELRIDGTTVRDTLRVVGGTGTQNYRRDQNCAIREFTAYESVGLWADSSDTAYQRFSSAARRYSSMTIKRLN